MCAVKRSDLKILIMAGGKGSRFRSIAEEIPKPMVDICGKPLLERQLECLKKQGFSQVTMVVGYLGHIIKDYFRYGERFGIQIDYIEEKEPLGTAGALYFVKEEHKTILLINGDILFDVDLMRMIRYHRHKHSDITLLTHPNGHPYDSALLETNGEGQVIHWFNKEEVRGDYKNRVNAGIHLIEPELFKAIPWQNQPVPLDLDRQVIRPMIKTKRVFAYDTPEYVKDIGIPERYQQVLKDQRNHMVQAKNLSRKQRAIFLDRDGTLNQHIGFLRFPDELKLLAGVSEAIRIINQNGYLAIVITNQPVIARGECTEKQLRAIHNRLERLLGENGAYVDDIFYCPHHPEKGFEGEVTEYKVNCECRKPKPGLIFQAAERYNIDLKLSYVIGDSETDMLAGIRAGCKTGYLCESTEKELHNQRADIQAKSLLEIVKIIFSNVETSSRELESPVAEQI